MEGEYKFLTAHFFKGSQKGQINSLWKKKENLERIEEYKKALAAGHVKLDQPLNRGQVKRMEAMGLTVPDNLRPPKKEKAPRVPRTPRDPNDIRLNHKQVARLQALGVTVPAEMMPIRGPRKPKVAAPTPVPPATSTPENPPQTPPAA